MYYYIISYHSILSDGVLAREEESARLPSVLDAYLGSRPSQFGFRIISYVIRLYYIILYSTLNYFERAKGWGAVWAESGHSAQYYYDVLLVRLGMGEGERATHILMSRASLTGGPWILLWWNRVGAEDDMPLWGVKTVHNMTYCICHVPYVACHVSHVTYIVSCHIMSCRAVSRRVVSSHSMSYFHSGFCCIHIRLD